MKNVMRSILLATSLGLIAGSTQAESATLNLSLNVPLSCAITSANMVDAQKGQVRLLLDCNAQAFNLQLSGDLAKQPIATASSPQAQITVSQNTLRVRTLRPGQTVIDIDYGSPLIGFETIRAEVHPL